MPRGDGTGPQGLGPLTGRGAGFCVETIDNNQTSPMRGRSGGRGMGFGHGQGMGRGLGRRNGAPAGPGRGMGRLTGPSAATSGDLDAQAELAQLTQHASRLQRSLDGLNERIEQLQHDADA